MDLFLKNRNTKSGNSTQENPKEDDSKRSDTIRALLKVGVFTGFVYGAWKLGLVGETHQTRK
jgi:hypothetical protein